MIISSHFVFWILNIRESYKLNIEHTFTKRHVGEYMKQNPTS